MVSDDNLRGAHDVSLEHQSTSTKRSMDVRLYPDIKITRHDEYAKSARTCITDAMLERLSTWKLDCHAFHGYIYIYSINF